METKILGAHPRVRAGHLVFFWGGGVWGSSETAYTIITKLTTQSRKGSKTTRKELSTTPLKTWLFHTVAAKS